ncbi:RICIN domain-containing protein [Streptomyces sp. DH7]|uniref:RICIN domain-containing protein n=1 Tax=Streptomyces sp. DH7 TaxID=2857006 RepID=UPI001E4B6A7F|nr:RICIN domain-containing protein [Streptomyces sp. DH7]
MATSDNMETSSALSKRSGLAAGAAVHGGKVLSVIASETEGGVEVVQWTAKDKPDQSSSASPEPHRLSPATLAAGLATADGDAPTPRPHRQVLPGRERSAK